MRINRRLGLISATVLLGLVTMFDFSAAADLAAARWKVLTPDTSPDAVTYPAMVALDGEVYLIGGIDTEELQATEAASGERSSSQPEDVITSSCVFLNDLWKFNPGTNQWSKENIQGDPLPPNRYGHSGTAQNGRIIVFGGFTVDEGSTLADLWSYDPGTSTFEELQQEAPLPPARGFHHAIPQDGSDIFVAGGESGGNLSDVWRLSGDDGTWEEKAPYPGTELDEVPLLPTGEELIAYDSTSSGQAADAGALANGSTIEYRYVIANDQWESQSVDPSSVFPARTDACFALTSTHGFVIGGIDPDTGDALSDAWAFDLATEQWTQLPDLPYAVSRLSGAVTDGDDAVGVFTGGLKYSGTQSEPNTDTLMLLFNSNASVLPAVFHLLKEK